MGDRVLYKTESLTDAYEELGALVRALEEVANGLDRVNTSAEWWGRVSARVSGNSSDARSAVRTLRSQVKRAVDKVSDIRSGIIKTRTAFDAADGRIERLADGVSRGSGHEWGHGGGFSGAGGGGGGGGAWGSASGGGFRGSGGGGGSGWGDEFGNELGDGAFTVFSGAFLPGAGLLTNGGGITAEAYGDWLGYELDDDHPGVTAWLGKAGATVDIGTSHTEVNAYLGKVKAEAKADGYFMQKKTTREFEDGEWKEKESFQVFGAEAALGASASLLAADYKKTTGNDLFGTETKLEGSVGNVKAKAKGKISLGDDGINAYAKGEAMVSAVEGKAKGTFNFLGFEISTEATGYAGAAGVEGEVGIKDGKFVMKGGVAAVLGGSVGIEIGLNDTGKQFVENVAEGFQDFAEGVGNVAESIGDWFASWF